MGDIDYIGPECFALKDGTVLSWRGVNYVPQEKRAAGANRSKWNLWTVARSLNRIEDQKARGTYNRHAPR